MGVSPMLRGLLRNYGVEYPFRMDSQVDRSEMVIRRARRFTVLPQSGLLSAHPEVKRSYNRNRQKFGPPAVTLSGETGEPGTSLKVELKLVASCNVVPLGHATERSPADFVIVMVAVPTL